MLIFSGTTLLVFVDSPGNAEQSVDTGFHAISLHGQILAGGSHESLCHYQVKKPG